jgi:seryl-tRNA synthetase
MRCTEHVTCTHISKMQTHCATRFSRLQQKINDLFMRLPNLLDSRVVDGTGEAENECVLEWGQEYIKVSVMKLYVIAVISLHCFDYE